MEWHKVKAAVGMKAVVFNSEGKILVLVRATNDNTRPSGYDMPGGGLDMDEDPKDGVRREIREETGLEVTDVKPIDTRGWREDDGCFSIMIIFQAKAINDSVHVSHEHRDYKWLSREEILSSDIPEDFKEFVKSAQVNPK